MKEQKEICTYLWGTAKHLKYWQFHSPQKKAAMAAEQCMKIPVFNQICPFIHIWKEWGNFKVIFPCLFLNHQLPIGDKYLCTYVCLNIHYSWIIGFFLYKKHTLLFQNIWHKIIAHYSNAVLTFFIYVKDWLLLIV